MFVRDCLSVCPQENSFKELETSTLMRKNLSVDGKLEEFSRIQLKKKEE